MAFETGDLMTPTQAALRLGVSPQGVKYRVRVGKLTGIVIAGKVHVRRDEVEAQACAKQGAATTA